MKRIIREVVTIIKVERWLVEEDAPSLAETEAAPLVPPTPPDPSLEPELRATLDEHTAHINSRAGSKIIRVITQRVIDSTQYRVK